MIKYYENGVWKMQNESGYIYVLINKKWIIEHRYNMEKFLGRELKPEEKIHHINRRKNDNQIDNLMLFPSQKEHASFHRKILQHGMTHPIINQIKNRFNNEENINLPKL